MNNCNRIEIILLYFCYKKKKYLKAPLYFLIAAELVGKYLFEDEKFLETLMKSKSDSKVRQVIDKIKELIDDLVVRFKGTEQEKQLREVQKKFIELYNSTDADIVENTAEKNTVEGEKIRYSLNDNLENVGKILYDNNSPLAIVNRAKSNNNSSINWVYKSEIFSVTENKLFHEKISEINQGSQVFEKNSRDEYMLPIGNKIIFTDGNYESPYIREIVEVLTEYQTEFEKIKERIFDVEKGESEKQDAVRTIKQVFGDEIVVTYRSGNNGVYGWENGKRKGKTRRTVVRNYLNKQYGTGNDKQSPKTQINDIAPTNETSSKDGVFSNAEKTKYSLSDSEGKDLSVKQSEYFKNSKIRDANGNLKVMYHGSHENFTVFDKNKARSGGTYGKGFYFTDSKSHAGTYGDSYDYYKAVESGIMYGQYNMREDYEKSYFYKKLPENICNEAFEMGREYKQKVTEEKAVSDKKTAAADPVSRVAFVEGISYNKLNKSQKAQVDFAQVIAQTFGFNLEIFRSPKNMLGHSIGENGSYNLSTNTMRLDIDAGTLDGKSLILFTQSHELTHFIKKWSPEAYKTFADLLVKKYGEKGVSVDDLVQRQINNSILAAQADKTGKHHKLSYDEAFDEVVANACEDFLADPNIQQSILDIAKVEQGIADKIKNFIKNLVNRLEKAIRGLQGQSAEANQLRGLDLDDIQELKAHWMAALVESRENVLQARNNDAQAQKNTTDEGDVKFMARSTKNGIVEYTPKEYNDFGWVAVNKILTGKELKKLYAQFADIKLNKYYNYKNKFGEYVIPVGDEYDSIDHIVYIKGTNKHPIIRQVIGFIDTISDEDRKNLTKDVLGDEYSKKFTDAFEIAEAYARKECFVRYMASDLPSYSVYRSRARRQNSSGASYDDGKRSNGKRNLSDSTGKVQNRDEVKLQDRNDDHNADLYSRISEMQLEVGRLRRSMESIETTDEFKEEQRKLSEAFSKDIDSGIKLYKEWLEKSEYSKLKNKKDALEAELDKKTLHFCYQISLYF